jgi:hypothetical protein
MTVVADSASSTAAWFTLAGALGGVLLTSVVALATAILNHRWQTRSGEQQLLQEHVRQLRQERREVYAHYWSAWNRLNHQRRALRDEVRKLAAPSNPKEQLAQVASDVVARVWVVELEWREAADALLLIGGEAVVEAAAVHIEVTERKLEAAWEGGGYPDEGGLAYRGLNDAMRSELLQPTKP